MRWQGQGRIRARPDRGRDRRVGGRRLLEGLQPAQQPIQGALLSLLGVGGLPKGAAEGGASP